MAADQRQLPIPPAALADPNAFELLRVWAAHGEQQVIINSDLEGGPEAFGYMIAQLLRHGANLVQQRDQIPLDEALARLRSGFDEEWNEPTGDPTGDVSE